MKLPGLTAAAALYQSGESYRTGIGQTSAGGRAGVQPAAIWRPHCAGCWICEPRWPFLCICYYPCPQVVALPPGLVAGPVPVAPGDPVEGGLIEGGLME
jgi:hypothetical protein